MSESKPAHWLSKLPLHIIRASGQRYGVDPFLIAAICQQESSGRIYAQRFEPNFRWLDDPAKWAKKLGCSVETEKIAQQTSYGLMQIMGAVLREYDFPYWFGASFDPETNINYGTRHLAKFLSMHETPGAIASYNAGAPRYIVGSRELRNQSYVDSVLKLWNEAKSSGA